MDTLPQSEIRLQQADVLARFYATTATAFTPKTNSTLPLRAQSERANGLLWLLLSVLVLAGLTQCHPARQAAQQHHRHKHAAPGRYEWHWADRD